MLASQQAASMMIIQFGVFIGFAPAFAEITVSSEWHVPSTTGRPGSMHSKGLDRAG